MSTTTTNLKLVKPDLNEEGWGDLANANFDALDAVTPVAALFVSPSATPLCIDIAAGSYEKQDGTIGEYAGGVAVAVPASSTTRVWMSAAGAIAMGSAWPSTALIRLATVVTNASAITAVVDERCPYRVAGNGTAPWLLKSGGDMDDGAVIGAGTSTGLKIGASGSQKIGIWGATPIVRPGTYSAGYTSTTRALAAYTPAVASTSFSGIASGVAGSPYAQVTDLNSLRAAYENLRAFAENDTQRLNALIADLKAIGLIS